MAGTLQEVRFEWPTEGGERSDKSKEEQDRLMMETDRSTMKVNDVCYINGESVCMCVCVWPCLRINVCLDIPSVDVHFMPLSPLPPSVHSKYLYNTSLGKTVLFCIVQACVCVCVCVCV